METGVPGEKPLQAKLRADYFSQMLIADYTKDIKSNVILRKVLFKMTFDEMASDKGLLLTSL